MHRGAVTVKLEDRNLLKLLKIISQMIRQYCRGEEICNKHTVSGLKIFGNGEFSQEYNRPREMSGHLTYKNAQGGPNSTELKFNNCLHDLLTSEKQSAVVRFLDKDSLYKYKY